MIKIVPLTEVNSDAIEHLLDTAFEPQRKRRTSYLIRADQPWLPALSFAALDEAHVFCGQLQCTRVALTGVDGVVHPITFVGPLAVLPSYQANGVGRALMNALMAAEAQQQPDTDAFAVIGDPDYFTRLFGFNADLTQGWQLPGPVDRRRLLAKVARARGLPQFARLGTATQSDSAFATATTTA